MRWPGRLLLLVLMLTGCAGAPPPAAPTPTLAGLAAVPTVTPPPTAPVTASAPATFTPGPTTTPAPTATATPPPCTAPAQIDAATLDSTIGNGPVRYRVFRPPCYGDDDAVYPVLYIFAGNIHDETKWQELGLTAAAEQAMTAGTLAPFVIVMPDGGYLANYTSGGPYSYEGMILDELIPAVEAAYCVWSEPAGRAIGGLSRGGYWALEIAFRHPDLFASVGGHSAALLDSGAGPDLNPQYTGLSQDLGDLRIYFDIGADDYLIANIQRLHESMAAQNVDHEWHLNEGGHEDAYWAAHAADYLAWYAAAWPAARTAYPNC